MSEECVRFNRWLQRSLSSIGAVALLASLVVLPPPPAAAEPLVDADPGEVIVRFELRGAGTTTDSRAVDPDRDKRVRGGRVEAEGVFAPSETFHVYVGGQADNTSEGGWNGGGDGGPGDDDVNPGNGGAGATDVRYGGDNLDDRIVVAGGAGGGGGTGFATNRSCFGGTGGAGGGTTGGNGQAPGYGAGSAATGGTQTSGGAAGEGRDDGSPGAFGSGGDAYQDSSYGCYGGGGGGGWYGGGGAGVGNADGAGTPPPGDRSPSGGGGSGYVDDALTELASVRGGGNGRNGTVRITYVDPRTGEDIGFDYLTEPGEPSTVEVRDLPDLDAPAAPGDVAVSDPQPGSGGAVDWRVDWTEPDTDDVGVDEYRVIADWASGAQNLEIVDGDETSARIRVDPSGGTVSVYAINVIGDGARASAGVGAVLPPSTPDAPSFSAARAADGGDVFEIDVEQKQVDADAWGSIDGDSFDPGDYVFTYEVAEGSIIETVAASESSGTDPIEVTLSIPADELVAGTPVTVELRNEWDMTSDVAASDVPVLADEGVAALSGLSAATPEWSEGDGAYATVVSWDDDYRLFEESGSALALLDGGGTVTITVTNQPPTVAGPGDGGATVTLDNADAPGFGDAEATVTLDGVSASDPVTAPVPSAGQPPAPDVTVTDQGFNGSDLVAEVEVEVPGGYTAPPDLVRFTTVDADDGVTVSLPDDSAPFGSGDIVSGTLTVDLDAADVADPTVGQDRPAAEVALVDEAGVVGATALVEALEVPDPEPVNIQGYTVTIDGDDATIDLTVDVDDESAAGPTEAFVATVDGEPAAVDSVLGFEAFEAKVTVPTADLGDGLTVAVSRTSVTGQTSEPAETTIDPIGAVTMDADAVTWERDADGGVRVTVDTDEVAVEDAVSNDALLTDVELAEVTVTASDDGEPVTVGSESDPDGTVVFEVAPGDADALTDVTVTATSETGLSDTRTAPVIVGTPPAPEVARVDNLPGTGDYRVTVGPPTAPDGYDDPDLTLEFLDGDGEQMRGLPLADDTIVVAPEAGEDAVRVAADWADPTIGDARRGVSDVEAFGDPVDAVVGPTVTVNSTADRGPDTPGDATYGCWTGETVDDGDGPEAECTLRAAIDYVDAADHDDPTIVLPDGIYATGPLDVASSVTIDGDDDPTIRPQRIDADGDLTLVGVTLAEPEGQGSFPVTVDGHLTLEAATTVGASLDADRVSVARSHLDRGIVRGDSLTDITVTQSFIDGTPLRSRGTLDVAASSFAGQAQISAEAMTLDGVTAEDLWPNRPPARDPQATDPERAPATLTVRGSFIGDATWSPDGDVAVDDGGGNALADPDSGFPLDAVDASDVTFTEVDAATVAAGDEPRRGVVLVPSGSDALVDAAGHRGPATDQRGVERPQGWQRDIGAYEATLADRDVDAGDLTVTVTGPSADDATVAFTDADDDERSVSVDVDADGEATATLPAGDVLVAADAPGVRGDAATVTVVDDETVEVDLTLRRPPRPAPDPEDGQADDGEEQVLDSGTSRIAGNDRVDTAAEIAVEAFPAGADTVVVATGDDPADSLAAVPLAATLDAPILLTRGDVADATADAIAELGAQDAVIVGGGGAVPNAAVGTLESLGMAVDRVAGVDRYGTAAAVAERIAEAGGSTERALVAVSDPGDDTRGWPDALAAGAYAGLDGTPILLTGSDRLPEPTRDALDGRETTAVGGEAVLPDATLAALGVPFERLGGADRWETAAQVADAAVAAGADPDRVWVATGRNWPDGLTAGAAAAATGGVLVLVDGDDPGASPATRDWLERRDPDGIWVVGGSAAVTPSALQQLVDGLGG